MTLHIVPNPLITLTVSADSGPGFLSLRPGETVNVCTESGGLVACVFAPPSDVDERHAIRTVLADLDPCAYDVDIEVTFPGGEHLTYRPVDTDGNRIKILVEADVTR